MFVPALSGICKYAKRFNKSLCSFQHDYDGDSKEDLERHISDIHTEESVNMTEDKQHFDLYVDKCFPEVYEKFSNDTKQINCYFSKYASKCKILRNIQK